MKANVAAHSSFVGQLSPDSDPTVITLPKGAILRDVQVSRNADIRRGQTVATLDVQAMERRIEEIQAELMHDNMLRECLLIEEVPTTTYFAELPELAQPQARLARQECKSFLEKHQSIADEAKHARALKAEQRRLVDRYIAVLSSATRLDLGPEKREENSRRALSLALLRNSIDRDMADLDAGANQALANWDRKRLDQVRSLSEQIRAKTDLSLSIQALVDRPRLQAPEDGLVVQVRRVLGDRAVSEDIDLIVLRPEGGVGYAAKFDIPENQLDRIAVGNKVRMMMLGILEHGPALTGTVSALVDDTGGGLISASVQLDPQSIAQLDDPQIGLALRGVGTASVIRVEKSDMSAIEVLDQTLRGAIPANGAEWFWKRLVAGKATAQPLAPL